MMRRVRVVLVAATAIVLAIPLLPGPGAFIIMAALADVHDAFQRPSCDRPVTAGFPPSGPVDAEGNAPTPLKARHLAHGRRVA